MKQIIRPDIDDKSNHLIWFGSIKYYLVSNLLRGDTHSCYIHRSSYPITTVADAHALKIGTRLSATTILNWLWHYSDVIMGAMASQNTSLTICIVYSTIYPGAERKHQCSASLVIVRGIHRWPVNSPRKWPVTRKMFPFDDVSMDFSMSWRYHVTCIYRVTIMKQTMFQTDQGS